VPIAEQLQPAREVLSDFLGFPLQNYFQAVVKTPLAEPDYEALVVPGKLTTGDHQELSILPRSPRARPETKPAKPKEQIGLELSGFGVREAVMIDQRDMKKVEGLMELEPNL
jgi:hypothetical protein